jgi:VanZ family protein
VGALAVAIAILSLAPHPEKLLPVTLWDKLGHILAYAALAAALTHALETGGHRPTVVLTGGILPPAAYGALIEVAQSFMPPRSAEPLDLLANLVGALVGAAALRAAHRSRRKTTDHQNSRLRRDGP